jgi:aldehyde dehydrogenase (NAD+)
MATVHKPVDGGEIATYHEILVDGEWLKSSGDEMIEVINPATEEPIARVVRGTADDVDLAARAAAGAFPAWSRTSIEERASALNRLADLIESRDTEITRLIVSEAGQPIFFATGSQTAVAVQDLRDFAEALKEVLWEEHVENFVVRREPVGVVGAITAWNGPLRSVCLKAGAAIAAGCTVVLKPSEVAPLSAYIFAELVAAAGIPSGVFNLVSGTGPEVGETIASHPLIDAVSLTGSVRAGSRVMELASARSSASRSNSVASRRTSSLTTPTSRPPWKPGSMTGSGTQDRCAAVCPACSCNVRGSRRRRSSQCKKPRAS